MIESLQSHILALLRKLPVAHPLTLQLLELRSYLLPALKSSSPTSHQLDRPIAPFSPLLVRIKDEQIRELITND